MTNLDKRIEQLEELKDKTMVMSTSGGISRESYLQLLVYHIGLLKEVKKLVRAFDDGDIEVVSKWYETRRQ